MMRISSSLLDWFLRFNKISVRIHFLSILRFLTDFEVGVHLPDHFVGFEQRSSQSSSTNLPKLDFDKVARPSSRPAEPFNNRTTSSAGSTKIGLGLNLRDVVIPKQSVVPALVKVIFTMIGFELIKMVYLS